MRNVTQSLFLPADLKTYPKRMLILLAWSFLMFVGGLPATSAEVDGELQLTTSAPDHLSGHYTRDGVFVQFDSTVEGDRVVLKLTTDAETPLVTITADSTTYNVGILGDQLRLTGQHQEGEATDEPQVRGDKSAAQKLLETSEYRVLPYLSRALGVQGIGARTHPASGPIHFIAMASAQANGVTFADDIEAAADAPEAPSSTQCKDQRGDPCGDNCFGMCGPNCTCWDWVCGNCCIWKKCLIHDAACEDWSCNGSFKGFAGCFLAAPYVAQKPCLGTAVPDCVDGRQCDLPGTCSDQGGIISGNSCCPGSCGTCGGSGCGSRPGGAASCCTSNIQAANLACSLNLAPCVIDPLPPDPQCKTGIISGNVCCAAGCGTCGGSGCGSRAGGAQSCCTGTIRDNDRSCKRNPPPCVMD